MTLLTISLLCPFISPCHSHICSKLITMVRIKWAYTLRIESVTVKGCIKTLKAGIWGLSNLTFKTHRRTIHTAFFLDIRRSFITKCRLANRFWIQIPVVFIKAFQTLLAIFIIGAGYAFATSISANSALSISIGFEVTWRTFLFLYFNASNWHVHSHLFYLLIIRWRSAYLTALLRRRRRTGRWLCLLRTWTLICRRLRWSCSFTLLGFLLRYNVGRCIISIYAGYACYNIRVKRASLTIFWAILTRILVNIKVEILNMARSFI